MLKQFPPLGFEKGILSRIISILFYDEEASMTRTKSSGDAYFLRTKAQPNESPARCIGQLYFLRLSFSFKESEASGSPSLLFELHFL